MTSDLSGRIALVTGGSRGIGKHIARALHRAGASVGITGRNGSALRQAVREIGEGCASFVCDQRDPRAIRRLEKEVSSALGEPDILVNNAGVYRSVGVDSMTLETWNEVLETNLTGVFLTTQAFLGGMLARERGDIFMIGSMSGKKGDPGDAAYCASKFGLQGFAQSLLYEARRKNIRVTVLNPSAVDTGLDDEPRGGPGLHLHAADLAATVVHLAALPSRTLVRDVDIWGTNPFR